MAKTFGRKQKNIDEKADISVSISEMTDLEQTYREEKPRLLNWLASRLNMDEDPEDVLQELFARAVDAASPIENVTAWLYASARNAVVDVWRGREKQSESLNEMEWDATPENLIREALVEGPDAEYQRNQVIEVLNDAIDDLPEGQQEIFLLQAIDGYTFSEVAELLDISINTAMSRKRYAVARLRERLQDYKEVR